MRGSSWSATHGGGERRPRTDEDLRLPYAGSSTQCFARRGQSVMPLGLQRALGPVLEQIAEMTIKIKQYEIQRMIQTKGAETQPLLTIRASATSPPSPSS